MDFENSFLSLEPKMRSCALVGTYMGHFAAMEAQLQIALKHSLNVDPLDALILSTNVGFANKIKILKSLNEIYVQDKDLCESNNKKLTKISEVSKDRNLVAHTPFIDDAEITNGVVFLKSSAPGKVNLNDIGWSVSDFKNKCDKLVVHAGTIQEIGLNIMQTSVIMRRALKNAKKASSNQG